MQLQENTLFANRYQLIKLLGRGGFSEVWLAKDNWTHLQIAIKVYAPGQGMDQDGLQVFCSELASVYNLKHTNLLKPQHVDKWQNMPYLIMAYCPSGSCVKRVGKMTEAELWKLIYDVAAGLAYLHGKDVIHQDIKPDNILVDTEGNYLITDFGISTLARSTLRKSVMSTTNLAGTLAYMGPERYSTQPAPTKASDIWSFGAMAFELLEGVVPFGEHGGGLQRGGAEIPFINANVSDALKYTIFKMLSKETWDRPTAATLIEWASNPSAIKVETELTISVNSEEINVPAEGGNSIVDVDTNGEWILPKAITEDWIRTTKYSYNAFTIKFDKNNTGKERAYTLVVPAVGNGNKAFANITIKQPSIKSKAWLWWILGVITVIILSVSISNAVERNRIEQQRIEQERIEQEDARKSQVTNEYEGIISTCNANLNKATVNNIQSLLDARKNVQRMKQIEANNHWLVAKSAEMNTKVENKCVKIYDMLKESSSKLAAKANNGELYFNDVHTEIYKSLDKQYQLFPTDQLKKERDSWK